MSIEQTTTPDLVPAACGCEPDTQVSTGSTCNPCMQRIVNEQVEQYIHAEALSGLLRGMARRAAFWRSQNNARIRQTIRADGEASEMRAELARVLPVVDAARAYYLAEEFDQEDYDALGDALAALDGDAAATPQPADVPDIRLAPDGSVWRGLGTRWVQLLSSGAHHLTPPADAVRLARASSAPPVDVAAAIREDETQQHDALDEGPRPSAEYLRGYRAGVERSAEVAAEALATPTTADGREENDRG